MITLADRITLARIVIAPTIAVCYFGLPANPVVVFWACGLLCAAAELTDLFDGKVARARGEVSDFGRLADPFCDVFYRQAVFLLLLLPPGIAAGADNQAFVVPDPANTILQPLVFLASRRHGPAGPVYVSGLVPFLPVLVMILREIVAGALRSMAATKGLVLAARTSGKAKAWAQGFTIISIFGLPALLAPFIGFGGWMLYYATVSTWICAALSAGSMVEYLWANRAVLGALVQRRRPGELAPGSETPTDEPVQGAP